MKILWSAMLRNAAILGITPARFWRLSLKEWRMLTELPAAARPMDRRDFEQMAEAWPDDRRV